MRACPSLTGQALPFCGFALLCWAILRGREVTSAAFSPLQTHFCTQLSEGTCGSYHSHLNFVPQPPVTLATCEASGLVDTGELCSNHHLAPFLPCQLGVGRNPSKIPPQFVLTCQTFLLLPSPHSPSIWPSYTAGQLVTASSVWYSLLCESTQH